MSDSDSYGNVSRNLRGCLGFALTLTVAVAGLLAPLI